MDDKKLKYIFGEVEGIDIEEYAKKSAVKFIRSQDQLAEYNETNSAATGQILTAIEALRNFGVDILYRAVTEGSAVIPSTLDEPSKTFRERRESLGLSQREVSSYLEISEEEYSKIELPVSRTPIKTLIKVSQALGLDDQRISLGNNGHGEKLAFRLKTMLDERRASLSPRDLLTLSESAWVIFKQSQLTKQIKGVKRLKWEEFDHDNNYGLPPNYPAWMHGYYLGNKLRKNIEPSKYIIDNAIPSLRALSEEFFQLPVIHANLRSTIAGATLSIEGCRGIVVNLQGANTSNAYSRRLTIAHELGHLLWDPEQNLNELRIDDYTNLDSYWNDGADGVEQRANAFSVEFLAPQHLLQDLYNNNESGSQGIEAVMNHFGISFTAAKNHLQNNGLNVSRLSSVNTVPSYEWRGREDFTSDYFPISTTQITRTGTFAGVVAHAYKNGLISISTAALYLNTEKDVFESQFETILELYPCI